MEKILFDTDIGTDVDDALALAYLLAQPECELLGITTVSGDVNARAMLASTICRAAGKDVPIYPGCPDCLLLPQIEPNVPQAVILPDYPHEPNFPQGEAIESMRQTIRRHPGEITLVAVGAMTNIALLFMVDTEIPKLLKGLALMCGRFCSYAEPKRLGRAELSAFVPNPRTQTVYQGYTDMNAIVDPYATAIVYNAPVKHHRSIGMDITRQVCISPTQFRDEYTHPILEPVRAMAEVWFKEADSIAFHDPLPAASMFMPSDIVTYRRVDASVEVFSPRLSGFIFYDENPQGHHEVADTVSKGKFLQHYKSVFHI